MRAVVQLELKHRLVIQRSALFEMINGLSNINQHMVYIIKANSTRHRNILHRNSTDFCFKAWKKPFFSLMLEINKPFLKRSVLLFFDWTYLGHFIIEFSLHVFWTFSLDVFLKFFDVEFFCWIFLSNFFHWIFSIGFFHWIFSLNFFFLMQKSRLNERWIENDPCTFYWSLFFGIKGNFSCQCLDFYVFFQMNAIK